MGPPSSRTGSAARQGHLCEGSPGARRRRGQLREVGGPLRPAPTASAAGQRIPGHRTGLPQAARLQAEGRAGEGHHQAGGQQADAKD